MQFSRYGTCDHLSLIIAAFALAIGMQRYRHHHVGAELFRLGGYNFDQPRSEPVAQAGQLFEFQEQHRFFQRFVVSAKASRGVESKEAIPAETAKCLLCFAKFQLLRRINGPRWNQEGASTAVAEWFRDRFE